LGVGGFPRGRVVEIFGPEASGKTTLALHAVASAQKAGGTAAFIDAEHALDATWARTCGVNTDDLLISQPDNGQQALEIADTLVRSGAVDIVVIDSVAALVPREEIERSEEHTSELQSLAYLVCRLLLPLAPRSTLFPYTTLFRSTRSTRSTRRGRGPAASTPTTCSSRSRTTANRRSRSPIPSCARARSTSSSSTRSRRSCRAKRSKDRKSTRLNSSH